MKNIKVFCAILSVIALSSTACASQKEPSKVTLENAVPDESTVSIEETAPSTASIPLEGTIPLSVSSSNDFETLFENANLQGHVFELSDTEIAISETFFAEDTENDCDIAMDVKPGASVDESSLTHISFDKNVSVRTLTMSLPKQAQLSITESSINDISKGSEVLVFGSKQDDTHWIATAFVIVEWQ